MPPFTESTFYGRRNPGPGRSEPEAIPFSHSMMDGKRKMKTLVVVGVLAFVFVAPAIALGDQSPTTSMDGAVQVATLDELRRELSPGDLISVVQITGDEVRGRLLKFGDADLDLQAEAQQAPPQQRRPLALKIPLNAIQSLGRPRDTSGNGALIGAGVGGGVSLAMFVYAAAVDRNEIDEWGPAYLAIGGLWTGLGALAGWAIDRVHSKPPVRFDAPSAGAVTIGAVPLLSRGPGMAMVLSF